MSEYNELSVDCERGDAPSSQRAIAMGRLDDEIEALQKAAVMLLEKLRPVLSPERTEASEAARISAVDTGESMHVQDIHRFRGKIEKVHAALDDLFMRCEV